MMEGMRSSFGGKSKGILKQTAQRRSSINRSNVLTYQAILHDFDLEVESRCIRLEYDAQSAAASLQTRFQVLLMKLPRGVRTMKVSELNSVYKGDLSAAIKDRRPRLAESDSANSKGSSRASLIFSGNSMMQQQRLQFSDYGNPSKNYDNPNNTNNVSMSKQPNKVTSSNSANTGLDTQAIEQQLHSLQMQMASLMAVLKK